MRTNQVGWMACCDETGGRVFEYTKEAALEKGTRLYSPRPLAVRPLYVGEDGANYIPADVSGDGQEALEP